MNIYCTFFPFFAYYELNNTYVHKVAKTFVFSAVLKTTKTCATDKKNNFCKVCSNDGVVM